MTSAHSRMLHLFEDWPHVAQRLRAAPVIALFLDFDGTLARLQPRPEDVSLDSHMREVLAALARSPRFRIWIISGRRRADVRDRVGIPGIRYLGLHGWEGRMGIATSAQDAARWLESVSSDLSRAVAGIPGLWIEDKEFALAVHYRDAASPDVLRARALLDDVLTRFAGRFRIQQGKSVWEILPWELGDKGTAVRCELASIATRALAIYIGDDQVDEPAFSALPDGLTVRVGRGGQSYARYRLSGIPQVRAFLDKLRTEFTR